MTGPDVESFTVEYHGEPLEFIRLPAQGWRYLCPAECCQAWHWIDTESGTRHRFTSDRLDAITIVGSLGCACRGVCTFHVMIENGVARDV